MIITKAPFRISFFGGGTDYPGYFEENGGSVLSATIDKYCYAIIRRLPPFFDYHTQVKYARTESVRHTEDLVHPLVRNCMLHTGMHNLSILYDADLPARSGIGSSSAFAAALLQGLYALQGRYISKEQLAKEAVYVERILCDEAGGWQDQVASAFGGLNRINFQENGFAVHPVVMPLERKQQLEQSLLLFFTGVFRQSSEIAKVQSSSVQQKKRELDEMKALVDEAEKILTSGQDLTDFGKLLDYTWTLKRRLTKEVSSEFIDDFYQRGRQAGAVGGKLLGAGGGGFILFFVPPERRLKVMESFKDFIRVPVIFEHEGASIIHYTPEIELSRY